MRPFYLYALCLQCCWALQNVVNRVEINGESVLSVISSFPEEQSLEGLTLQKMHNINTKEDFYNLTVASLLSDHENSFHLQKANRTVYYDKSRELWYMEWHESPFGLQTDVRVPLTWCYDMSQGPGGAINQAFEILLSTEQLFGKQGKVEGIMQVKGTILLGLFDVSLTESITYKGTHSCQVKAGKYARLYIKPQYIHIPERKRVAIRFDESQEIEEIGEVEVIAAFKRLILELPVMECAFGNEDEICDMGIL